MKLPHFLLIIFTAALYGCSPNSGEDIETPTTTKGRMDFKLTDDPGMFAYFKIELLGMDYNESNDPNTTTGWVPVPLQNPGIIDIIQFSNGRERPLGSLELLPATVKQVRLRLGNNNSFAVWSGPVGGNYAFFDLPLHPSIVNGLVLPCNIQVQSNGTNRIYLDFDASRSRLQTGSTSWLLLPHVRLFESSQIAALDGRVFPPEARPYVRVIYLNHTSPMDWSDTAYGYPDQTGYFKIIGLSPNRSMPDSVAGIQKIEFIPRLNPGTPYQPQEKTVQLVNNVTVSAGTTTLVQ
jgi:Domain of unknown function (DUF4382)